ncbi:MAG: helix-turn-helix transcriptional regulator [Helcococcus sp.]|nr:helix-turn-helix transcriptional regulator [Helcococcus sp.]
MKKPLREFLKDRRKELRLSQDEVADYIGVTKSAISRWESGDIKNMGVDKLRKYAHVLNLDPMVIINYEEDDYEEFQYFTSAKEAMKFMLNQTVVMGFNGLDVTKLSEEEQIQYANDMLDMMKLVSLKYKDKK